VVTRHLVLHLPAFRLERCGYDALEVVALIADERGAARIVALTPAARDAGLTEGTTAAEARARCPDVLLEPWDPVGEGNDRAALAAACARFTDRVRVLSGDDLDLDVTGTAHLFGGDDGVLDAAREVMGALGHRCRLAIAQDAVAARALAVAGPEDVVVPPGEDAAALARLPTAALFPSPELGRALEALGLHRIGAFAALDPASVSGRFGAEGAALHRVARGLPATSKPAGFLPEPAPISARVTLGGPTVTLAPVFFVLPGLVRRLCDEVGGRGEGVARLTVVLALETGGIRRIQVTFGQPTSNPDTIAGVIRARLENVRLDAPLVELALDVDETSEELGGQKGLVDRVAVTEPLPDLLARLSDALGPDACFATVPRDTWRPESAWAPAPFRPDAPPPGPVRPAKVDPVELQERFDAELPRPRPTRLLPRPEPVQVRGDPPTAVHGAQGWEPVRRISGPERLTSAWWDPDLAFDRIYWVVETRSGAMWLYRERDRWLRQGWFD
jgi:protein ImuB